MDNCIFIDSLFLFSSSEDTELVPQKKRHRKKTKKTKRGKAKKREVTSESESDSSSSSSSTSCDGNIRKRKKQKKQKKYKLKSRHDASSSKPVATNDSDVQALSTKDTQKVLYISSDENANGGKLASKKLKRIDDLKKLRGTQLETGDREFKSKWDSPSDEYEKKRYV